MVRRHHLIEESKAELDVAYDEVKHAEQAIMALEQEYNERIQQANGSDVSALMAEKEARQEKYNLEHLYALQTVAVERFAKVSAAFTIVASVEDDEVAVDLLRNILFTGQEIRENKLVIDKALKPFVSGLRSYMREDSNQDTDKKVRESWTAVEGILRRLGRDI